MVGPSHCNHNKSSSSIMQKVMNPIGLTGAIENKSESNLPTPTPLHLEESKRWKEEGKG